MSKFYNFYSVIIFIVTLVGAPGCNRENAFDCVQRTGRIVVVERQVDPFYYVIIKDNIDVVLTSGTGNVVKIEAGKNLMPDINLYTQGDTLTISNANSCNWVRSYKHRITVSLPAPNTDLVLFHRGYGKITSTEKLNIQNLSIYSLDAGGNIDLQIQSGKTIAYSNSHAMVQLSGQTSNLDIWMHKGIGRIYTENLMATHCIVKQEGSNEIRIFPIQQSYVEINASGNVAYYNEPVTMTSSIHGSGKLIKR